MLYRKDDFIIECPTVGKIKMMTIWHDNGGRNPGWYLNKVIVVDLTVNSVFEFPCDRWLSDRSRYRSIFARPYSGGERLVFTARCVRISAVFE